MNKHGDDDAADNYARDPERNSQQEGMMVAELIHRNDGNATSNAKSRNQEETATGRRQETHHHVVTACHASNTCHLAPPNEAHLK
jgi:hypothetical protein